MFRIRKIKTFFLLIALSAITIVGFKMVKSYKIYAFSTPIVSIQNGKIYYNNQEFKVKGVNYNPVAIGTDQFDTTAPSFDVPAIASLNANTIGTYNVGKFEWDQWSDLSVGQTFYSKLYPVAEQYNLKIIVGYFSNPTIDWTDSTRVSKVTNQYKELVLQAKDRPSTLMYLIGNEVFENMGNDVQRTAYSRWIGEMVEWTHTADPDHPVTYADNALHSALPWLKSAAPSLDIYSVNNYEWSNYTELLSNLNNSVALWPGKPVFLHEWGVDSFDTTRWSQDESLQANKIQYLSQAIESVYANGAIPFIGSVYFEYSDQWDKVGSSSTQDPDQGWPWACNTCFDGKANQDYWGITRSVGTGQAAARIFKQGYYTLQQAWKDSAPSATPSLTPSPKPSSRPRKIKGNLALSLPQILNL